MLKSKLFWKVIGNFGFLLLILTAMTYLITNMLRQIEEKFNAARADMQSVQNVNRLASFIDNVPPAAREYAFTGSPAVRAVYESGLNDFSTALTAAQKDFATDTSSTISLKRVEDLYYSWIQHVGNKFISIHEERLTEQETAQRLKGLFELEANVRYIPIARSLLKEITQKKIVSSPASIEFAINLSQQMTSFIMIVNVLVALFSLALGFVLTRSITKPVQKLKEGTKNIVEGKYEPIDLHRSDELGELANDFNNMAKLLGSTYTRLNAYSELVTELNTHETIEEVESRSLALLCQHSGAVIGAVYEYDPDAQLLQLTNGYALDRRTAATKHYALGDGIPGQCALLRKPLEVADIQPPEGFTIQTGIADVVPRSIVAVPILFQEKLLGVIVLGSMTPFDDTRKDIINNSVPQIGVAITNARNYEAAQKLSREVAKRNEELDGKNAELEKAYRVKSDFLASMSHELRTPLNSIIGFSSVLLGPNGDPLTNDQRKALDKVLKNGKHLLQLINDILDFSKIESGRMTVNVESEEVAEVVSNSLMTVEALVKAKGLMLKQEIEPELPMLATDVLKAKQIMVNLLSNAVKFTDAGEIAVTVRKLPNGFVSFAVKDSGIGIEEKNYERVFEEFQQIDTSNTRKYKGTGLGLPISRRLARILGGDLTVHSVYGQGSTFTLAIPPVYQGKEVPSRPAEKEISMQPKFPAPTPQSGAVPVMTSGSGTKILCIDDDPDVIEILRKYLVPEGYAVTGALSGDEGIKLARELQPSLITLDIMMPNKDGWEVLRELKQHGETRDIPVIIHSIIDNRPLAISLGALDVMTKPVEPKRLLSIVERTCKSNDEFVLVVDDDIDYTIMLRELLTRDGFRTKVVNSGSEALEILRTSTPALILLDLIMPNMDGMEVVRRLQQHETWKNIPVVILSGKELSKQERDELNSHIWQYLQKSEFSREVISGTIRKILNIAHTN